MEYSTAPLPCNAIVREKYRGASQSRALVAIGESWGSRGKHDVLTEHAVRTTETLHLLGVDGADAARFLTQQVHDRVEPILPRGRNDRRETLSGERFIRRTSQRTERHALWRGPLAEALPVASRVGHLGAKPRPRRGVGEILQQLAVF